MALEYRDLMAQDEDLDVLGAVGQASRTSQPNTRTMIKYKRRTDTNRDLARNCPTRPNRTSQALRQVLKRYRVPRMMSLPLTWSSLLGEGSST